MDRSSPARRAFTLIELLVVLGVVAALLAILLPVFFAARERGRSATCLSNLRQLDTALLAYAQDADGFFPTRGPTGTGHQPEWTDGVSKYVRDADVFHCPSCPIPPLISQQEPGEPKDVDGGYALNYEISGAHTTSAAGAGVGPLIPTADMTVPFPSTTVALCEVAFRSGPEKNAVSFSTATNAPDTEADPKSGETVIGQPGALRHQGGSNYAFVDGHVRWYRPDQVTGAEDTVNRTLVGNKGSAPTFAR